MGKWKRRVGHYIQKVGYHVKKNSNESHSCVLICYTNFFMRVQIHTFVHTFTSGLSLSVPGTELSTSVTVIVLQAYVIVSYEIFIGQAAVKLFRAFP